jgi:hypothetical protein
MVFQCRLRQQFWQKFLETLIARQFAELAMTKIVIADLHVARDVE